MQLASPLYLPTFLNLVSANPVNHFMQIHRHADVVGNDVHAVADGEIAAHLGHIHIAVLFVHLVEAGFGCLYDVAERNLARIRQSV